MRYRFFDGFEFDADGALEIATALWESKFIPEPTIEEWMEGLAKRARMWNGTELRTSSVEELVEDIFAAGFLKALP